MKSQRFLTILILTFTLFLGVKSFADAAAAAELCRNQTNFKQQLNDIQVPSCVASCKQVTGVDTEKSRAHFEKNCRHYADNKANVDDSAGAVQQIIDTVGVKCIGFGIMGAAVNLAMLPVHVAVGTYQASRAMYNLVGQALEPGPAKKSFESKAGFWKSCAQNKECQRALARNTLRFQDRNLDQSWKTSDAEVDQFLSTSNFNELVIQAQHDQQLSKKDCERNLASTRKQIQQKTGEMGFAEQQEVFNALMNQTPHCVGVLKLAPPVKPAENFEDLPLEQCLAKNPQAINCLTMNQKVRMGSICHGQEFTDGWKKIKDKACEELIADLVPVPVGSMVKVVSLSKTALRAEAAAVTNAGSGVSAKLAEKEIGQASGGVGSAGASGASNEVISRSSAKISDAAARSTQAAKTQNFVDAYKEVSVTSEVQNRKYIALATASSTKPSAKTRFFDVENAVMKKLNDTTKDKNLVSGLTNFQKENFLKNLQPLKEKYPDVNFELYSDFKSVKIAMESKQNITATMNKQLVKDLDEVYQKSNKEFSAKMKELDIDVPAAGDPKDWFKAGYGQSVDEAALAARKARQSDSGNAKVLEFSSDEVQGEMSRRLSAVDNARQNVATNPRMKNMLEESADGYVLPKQDVFDLVRKNDSPESLAKAVSDRYQTSFSVEDARHLQNYSQKVDEFSPTILVAKRENVNLDQAVAGGASADFLGIGSANSKATAAGLAGKKDLNEAIKGVRKGEQEVTKTFQSRMDSFKKVVGGEVICSGDDCVRIAAKTLSEAEKSRMLDNLARNPDTRQVRMSFVGPGVATEHRMQIATHGEAIEKAFRKELEGRVPFSKLEKMTFGFDMKTTKMNQGEVDLIIGKNNNLKLSSKEQSEIQSAFARALEKQNKSKAAYTQGNAKVTEKKLIFIPGVGLTESEERP